MSAILTDPIAAVFALILGFGFLIFVHELGHFAVAKWVGIRATQFAIGFGNALLAYRKGVGLRVGGTEKIYLARALEALREEGTSVENLGEHKRNQLIMEKADQLGLGETEYRLNWIPLGGYVKMLGQEDMDPAAQSDDPRAFNRKSIGARAAVISAGVIMNLIFGLIFFIICFQIGVKFPAPVVGAAAPGQPAATTYANGHEGDPDYRGLRPGDVITHLAGKPVTDMAAVKIAAALGKSGDPVVMTVDREGEPAPLIYEIVPESSELNEGLLSDGIIPADTLTVGESPDRPGQIAGPAHSPFVDAQLRPGMTLSAVNGKPVENYGQFVRAFENLTAPDLTLRFTDPADGQTRDVTTTATPQLARHEELGPQLLGLLPPVVVDPAPGKPAEKAGIQSHDVLAQLGDAHWPSITAVSQTIKTADGQALALVVDRRGETVELAGVKPRGGLIGVSIAPYLATRRIAGADPDSPFARAAADRPLPPGSRLLSVNGQPIEHWADFAQAVHAELGPAPDADTAPVTDDTDAANADTDQPDAGAATLELAFEINLGASPRTETYTVTLTPDEAATLRDAYGWLPPRGLVFEPMLTEVKADGPWEATVIGVQKTGEFIQQTYITLLRLFQGTVAVKNLRGPVGIVDQGAKVAAQGLPYYLFFLGLISVNLAVLNFLPLPIVDGGLMVFLLIEKFKGSPASPKVQTAVALVGLVGLAGIFLYVTFNDISRIVAG
ncbi:MAG: site-2 protease family protein [Planctomycetota bacterium]